MAIMLTLWGMLSGALGLLTLLVARNAVHEIQGAIGLLIATVAIGCAAIVETLKKNAAQSVSQPAPSKASDFDETSGMPRESGRLVG